MLHLIIGGSASGKSHFAEEQLSRLAGRPLYYLATMQVWDEEGRLRVLRHRAQREGKGFETIECPTHLEELTLKQAGAVLLEDLGNLLTNESFTPNGIDEEAPKRILRGIDHLLCEATDLIVVSNDVFCDWDSYSDETKQFIKQLGYLNQMLAQRAQRVTEVVCGIPLTRKGEPV